MHSLSLSLYPSLSAIIHTHTQNIHKHFVGTVENGAHTAHTQSFSLRTHITKYVPHHSSRGVYLRFICRLWHYICHLSWSRALLSPSQSKYGWRMRSENAANVHEFVC